MRSRVPVIAAVGLVAGAGAALAQVDMWRVHPQPQILKMPRAQQPKPAPAGERNFVVDVVGTAGVRFAGSCNLAQRGRSFNGDVTGVAPATFYFTGNAISCLIEKRDSFGQLRLLIKTDAGQLIGQSLTQQGHGVATAASR